MFERCALGHRVHRRGRRIGNTYHTRTGMGAKHQRHGPHRHPRALKALVQLIAQHRRAIGIERMENLNVQGASGRMLFGD